jgi:hypothetical protein
MNNTSIDKLSITPPKTPKKKPRTSSLSCLFNIDSNRTVKRRFPDKGKFLKIRLTKSAENLDLIRSDFDVIVPDKEYWSRRGFKLKRTNSIVIKQSKKNYGKYKGKNYKGKIKRKKRPKSVSEIFKSLVFRDRRKRLRQFSANFDNLKKEVKTGIEMSLRTRKHSMPEMANMDKIEDEGKMKNEPKLPTKKRPYKFGKKLKAICRNSQNVFTQRMPNRSIIPKRNQKTVRNGNRKSTEFQISSLNFFVKKTRRKRIRQHLPSKKKSLLENPIQKLMEKTMTNIELMKKMSSEIYKIAKPNTKYIESPRTRRIIHNSLTSMNCFKMN